MSVNCDRRASGRVGDRSVAFQHPPDRDRDSGKRLQLRSGEPRSSVAGSLSIGDDPGRAHEVCERPIAAELDPHVVSRLGGRPYNLIPLKRAVDGPVWVNVDHLTVEVSVRAHELKPLRVIHAVGRRNSTGDEQTGMDVSQVVEANVRRTRKRVTIRPNSWLIDSGCSGLPPVFVNIELRAPMWCPSLRWRSRRH